MKRWDSRLLAAALVFSAVASCKGDPTADLRSGPAILSLSPDLMFIDSGDTKGLEVVVRDQQLNPVSAEVTVTSNNPSLFTVAPDTAAPSADNARHDFIVRALGLGRDRAIITGAGLTDTTTVTVLPIVFAGAVSTATPQGGDTVKIASTSLLKFDPAEVSVTLSTNDQVATVIAKSADTVTVLAPFGPGGVYIVSGVAPTYAPGVVISVPTSVAITQTGDLWGTGDVAFATAPALPLPAAPGDTTHMITNFGGVSGDCGEGGETCVIYAFTLAAPAALKFVVDWNSAADVDAYICDDTGVGGCFEDGGTGATTAHPETIGTFTYPAGTHYLSVELFEGPLPSNIHITIIRLAP